MKPPAKKCRGLWSLQQLEAAMAAVKGRVLSQRAAAAQYSIPRRTLSNHLKSGKVEKKLGRRTILTAEQERDLATRIKRLASIGFPLTPKVLRHQAYIFCQQYNITNCFNQSTKRAGKDWLKLFLKRHPDLTKRKVQILNPGRAQKLNKSIVMEHFNEFKKIYEQLKIRDHPQRLYNMDEKGCRLTIHNQPTVLAHKGSKRVHLVAPEHAENVTVAACVNAVGNTIPPMIIFKGKRLKPEYHDNLPAGSIVKMAPKGSMTSSLFVEFIHHLGKYKTAGKCLLVFDGASCHLDYQIVDAADQEEIVLYCLPSNTTHELQPLDKSVNKSFEHHWDEQTISFLYRHPDRKLTKARFNNIFSKVWAKCMSHENIVNGFRATGLYPFNPDAIPVEAYAPSVLTQRPATQENDSTGHDQSSQKSPTPGPSGINLQPAVQSPIASDSSDSDKTSFEDGSPRSPSLLQGDLMQPYSTSTDSNKRLVDYSTTDSDSTKSDMSDEPSKLGAKISRPVIYSSESDTSINEIFIPLQRPQPKPSLDIYSSSDGENLDPLLDLECTPDKQVQAPSRVNVNVIKGDNDSSDTSDDSMDNIPLARLKSTKNLKSPFQQLIPTPNYVVIKQKPRRKAINYKARIVTKDLFKEIDKEKDVQKKQQKRKITDNKLQGNKRKRQIELKLRKESKNGGKTQKIKTNTKRGKNPKEKKMMNKHFDAEDKWYCHACNTERFEDMRQCPLCQRWFHEECLGLSKEDIEFECPFC